MSRTRSSRWRAADLLPRSPWAYGTRRMPVLRQQNQEISGQNPVVPIVERCKQDSIQHGEETFTLQYYGKGDSTWQDTL